MSLLFDERNDLANLCKYLPKCELLYTVFLWIVVATTILFLGFGCDNYSREETIRGNTVSKKAAVLWHVCLIGNICNNFLVPRMNESAPKTFMPIQTSDLYRVNWRNSMGTPQYGIMYNISNKTFSQTKIA